MKNEFMVHNIAFEIGNYTPRNNEFERGLKYELFLADAPNGKQGTGFLFSTKKRAKEFAEREWILWAYMQREGA